MEVFKDIVGFEGKYQISNLGNVKSLNYKNTHQEKLLKPVPHSKGYLKIQLMKDGKRKSFFIHRLVAEAFLSNPDNKPEVNHINSNRQDNRLENLEWVSTSENALHRWRRQA